jgi:hypothetical protein
VHSQADTEQADLTWNERNGKADTEGEHRELAAIYVARRLNPELARQVADQLMAHAALEHMRGMSWACPCICARRRSGPDFPVQYASHSGVL